MALNQTPRRPLSATFHLHTCVTRQPMLGRHGRHCAQLHIVRIAAQMLRQIQLLQYRRIVCKHPQFATQMPTLCLGIKTVFGKRHAHFACAQCGL